MCGKQYLRSTASGGPCSGGSFSVDLESSSAVIHLPQSALRLKFKKGERSQIIVSFRNCLTNCIFLKCLLPSPYYSGNRSPSLLYVSVGLVEPAECPCCWSGVSSNSFTDGCCLVRPLLFAICSLIYPLCHLLYYFPARIIPLRAGISIQAAIGGGGGGGGECDVARSLFVCTGAWSLNHCE